MFGLSGLGLGGRAGGGLVVGAWTTTFWHATDPRSASKVINGSARLAMVALAQLIDDGRLCLSRSDTRTEYQIDRLFCLRALSTGFIALIEARRRGGERTRRECSRASRWTRE